jgi:hypothetical protein
MMTVFACDGTTSPSEPEFGYIRLMALTTGGDPDGLFDVAADTVHISLSANQIIYVRVSEGQHSVTISDVAANCLVAEGTTIPVNVARNDTVAVTLNIDCAATGISVVTLAEGFDIPNLVQLVIPSFGTTPVLPNSTSPITLIPPGRYQVTLRTGVPHCSVAGDSTVTVDVVNRQLSPLRFDIHCVFLPLTGTIAYSHGSKIRVINSDGTGEREMTTGFTPEWSRDGTKLLYSTTVCDYYSYNCTGALAMIDRVTGKFVALDYALRAGGPKWSPVDDVIAYVDLQTSKVYLLDVAASTTAMVNVPDMIARSVSWSPDGTRLAIVGYSGNTWDVRIVNRDGSGLTHLNVDGYTEAVSWSPDGKTLAFSVIGSEGRIKLIEVDGSNLRDLARGYTPAWSPDGSQIIYAEGSGLFVMNKDGSNQRRLTAGNDYYPAWRRP